MADHGHGIENKSLPKSGWLPNGGTITQGFNVWEYIPELGINAPHQGIDVAGRRGDPVMTPEHAVVEAAGWDPFGGGNFVKLLLDGGQTVELFHLQNINVKQGQDLSANTLLGHLDSTGASTGDHLHFQVNSGGKSIDPWSWLVEVAKTATPPSAEGGTPFDAFKNMNDFFGHLTTPGHSPCDPPADEMGLFRAIDAATCPQNWWKVLFSSVGVVLISVGIIIYFFEQEKQIAVKVIQEAPAAAEVA